MEQLHNGFTLEFSPGVFPLSTDSVVLADFARLPKNASVLDLCSGCGTLGLLLCAKDPGCVVTGIELDPAAHQMALHNAQVNQLQHRLKSICGDLACIHTKPGSFACCISNPPYFSAGPESKATPLARRDDLCSMDTLIAAAARALKFGGDFFLVHRPERLAELCAIAAKYNLQPKRLLLLRHRPDAPVSLIFVQCRKGAKPGLIWEERFLYEPDGAPSKYYKTLYHI